MSDWSKIEKPTITIKKDVGCGEIYCIFVEHKNGNLYKVLIRGSMAKTAPCGESFLWAISRLLTYAIIESEKETDIKKRKDLVFKAITKQLLAHSCNVRSLKTELSCSHAIGLCVQEYMKRNETTQEKS